VEAEYPDGCNTPWDAIVAFANKDPETLVLLLDAGREEVGRPEANGMCDNVTHSLPPTGNSTEYAVRRLRDHAPELLGRVKAGELTAHRAMVKAGFREETITISKDPEKAARRLLRHFQGERLEALIDHLQR